MIKALKDHPTYTFILKTLFYFVVLVALVYLYGYFGAGQAPFIYNEF
ncbi:teichoic acid D-Ala incorporation-associated protein DltX [uncultured Limosilactobacillus sp.]|nr:teichoic acid D-Ala incorporation-associated protein DltX [uncultured Limosilactobacillus sp.]